MRGGTGREKGEGKRRERAREGRGREMDVGVRGPLATEILFIECHIFLDNGLIKS